MTTVWQPLVLIIILLILVLYKWATLTFNALHARGVPHVKPKPLFGNLSFSMIMAKTSFTKYLMQLHTTQFKDSKVYGIYCMRNPVILIRDLELLRKILVQDFHYFRNHNVPYAEFERNLVDLKDQEWLEMRAILTPAFTNCKMRLMFELMNECCIEGIAYLYEQLTDNENKGLELEMEDTFTRFTNDVIASAALGIKVISFRQKQNCFFNISSTILNFRGLPMLKALLVEMMPRTMKFLGVRVLNVEKLKYFENLVLSTIKYREQHHIVRPDLLTLLVDARKQKNSRIEKKMQLNDRDVVAQCLLFFCAGFSKVSTCLCFTAHELMANPDIQEKVYQEVHAVARKLDGKPLNYDILINEMNYMDMVIYESLRKWPPAFTDRVCFEDYDLTDSAGNLIAKLRKNDDIWIPIFALHHNPEYFKNPEKFDPERFSTENRKKINPFTYLPFGIGPRHCLGHRFALLEIKMILYHIVVNFQLVPSTKTLHNLNDGIRGFHLTPENFWIKLLPRKKFKDI